MERIYRRFHAFIAPHPLACGKGCTACCTRNVIMTALEGRWILENLNAAARRDLLDRITAAITQPRFQPCITFNRMADQIESGEAIPEESGDPDWGMCPLLEEEACTIYAFRPFMCRSMVSEVSCRDVGHATVKPIVLTVAHVLMQVIEHLDVRGFSGNLSDVLLELAASEGLVPDAEGVSTVPRAVIVNYPLRRLMVPGEHRKEVQAFLGTLSRRDSGEVSEWPGSAV